MQELADPSLRRLVSRAHGIFTTLQARCASLSARSDELRAQLKSSSRQYRHALFEAVLALDAAAAEPDAPESMVALCNSLKVANTAWHLCEIYFVGREHAVAAQVMAWLTEHFELSPTELLADPADPSGAPVHPSHRDPRFWDVVFQLAAQGQLEYASEMLSTHPASSATDPNAPVNRIAALLSSYPHYAPASGIPEPEYVANWTEWQASVHDARRARVASSLGEGAEAVLTLLSGDFTALAESADARHFQLLNEHWYIRLHATLLFGKASTRVRRGMLSRLMEDAVRHSTASDGQPEDPIVSALLRTAGGDGVAALRVLLQSGQIWAAAHLADLLAHNDSLPMRKTVSGWDLPLRDHLLMEHASSLFSQPALASLAVSYLTQLGDLSVANALAEEFVARTQVDSDRQAARLVALCARLPAGAHLAASVQRTRGMYWLRKRNYGAALRWLMRAGDQRGLAIVANKLLGLCDAAGGWIVETLPRGDALEDDLGIVAGLSEQEWQLFPDGGEASGGWELLGLVGRSPTMRVGRAASEREAAHRWKFALVAAPCGCDAVVMDADVRMGDVESDEGGSGATAPVSEVGFVLGSSGDGESGLAVAVRVERRARSGGVTVCARRLGVADDRGAGVRSSLDEATSDALLSGLWTHLRVVADSSGLQVFVGNAKVAALVVRRPQLVHELRFSQLELARGVVGLAGRGGVAVVRNARVYGNGLPTVDAALGCLTALDDISLSPRLEFVASYRQLLLVLQDIAAVSNGRAVAPSGAGAAASFSSSDVDFAFKEAGRRLHALIAGGVAPRKWWARLLHLGVVSGILLHSPCALTTLQAHDLMRCLEEIKTSHRADEYLGGLAVDREALDRVHVALTHALSAAIVDSCTASPEKAASGGGGGGRAFLVR